MEEYQTTKEKEMYKSKINFFINLVHEIRTPLSLIRLPLEKLREEEIKGKENKYISVIEKNVDYLLGIINQLLDFRFIHFFFFGSLILLHPTFILTPDIQIPTPTKKYDSSK